jgi:hypothetical protein
MCFGPSNAFGLLPFGFVGFSRAGAALRRSFTDVSLTES